MKILHSTIEKELIDFNKDLANVLNLENHLLLGEILPKADNNGYWYNLESVINCTNKNNFQQYVNNKLRNLSRNITLLEYNNVEDLIENKFLPNYEELKKI